MDPLKKKLDRIFFVIKRKGVDATIHIRREIQWILNLVAKMYLDMIEALEQRN